MGRPPKAIGEKAVKKSFSFPPELWAEIELHIPEGERSGLVQQCLGKEAKRRKKVTEGGAE